ncbi:MAG: HAD-IA family hydrolase [Firmicutes bacterium]|nr:HAD-IA family hydrolase [Bacillota bacterium]
MSITTVVFDFDGTIMNTTDVILGSWQHTFMTLEGRERPEADILPTLGEPLHLTMSKFFPDKDVEECVEIYRSYHRDNFGPRITLFPGVKDLLAELKARGLKVGLATSRLHATTVEGLEKYELAEYFDYVLTANDTDKHKPDPTPLLMTLEKLGSTPEESLMVGDTVFDFLCARNAGVKFVLVGWQVAFPKDMLESPEGPEYIIKDAKDLLTLV